LNEWNLFCIPAKGGGGGGGTPPPPPAPALPKKKVITPGTKMRQFAWNKINPNKLKDTVWTKVHIITTNIHHIKNNNSNDNNTLSKSKIFFIVINSFTHIIIIILFVLLIVGRRKGEARYKSIGISFLCCETQTKGSSRWRTHF
jgi:hypothetical protein